MGEGIGQVLEDGVADVVVVFRLSAMALDYGVRGRLGVDGDRNWHLQIKWYRTPAVLRLNDERVCGESGSCVRAGVAGAWREGEIEEAVVK